MNKSGTYFDSYMFYNENYDLIRKDEAEYFLKLENYNVSEDKYINNLETLFNNRKNKNIKGYIFKQKKSIKSMIIGRCAWRYRRNYNFK